MIEADVEIRRTIARERHAELARDARRAYEAQPDAIQTRVRRRRVRLLYFPLHLRVGEGREA